MKVWATLLLFLLANFSFAKSQGEFFSCETTNNKILTLRKVGNFIEYEFAKKKPRKVELKFKNSIKQVAKFGIDSVAQTGYGRYYVTGFAMINNFYVYEITSAIDRLNPNEELPSEIHVYKLKAVDLEKLSGYPELSAADTDDNFKGVTIKCKKTTGGFNY